MRGALRILPLAALWLLLVPGAGRSEDEPVAAGGGDERVLFYRSEVTVLPDASLVVREMIRVRAAGDRIKRGIYRDFPTRLRSSEGIWLDVPFRLIEVLRNGQPERWRTEEREHGVRAYLGDPAVQLPPGEHTYLIAYGTERQLGFLPDHDELAWNVNGHDWTLPVDAIEARVLLPRGIPGVDLEVRTGPRGRPGREATASWEGERGGSFRATRPFEPGEGLTVILRWPKGFVREPDPPRSWWRYFTGENRGVLAGLAGLLLVLTYNFLAGRHAGRNLVRAAATPSGRVPAGLSPAAVRALRTGRCDERAFAATLVLMAVKGYLLIEEQGGRYALRRGEAERTVLAPEEALIADDLDLEWTRRIELDPANGMRIDAAGNDLKNFLRVSLERFHVLRNREYLLPGVALSLVVLVSTLRFEPGLLTFIRGLISVLLFLWTIGVALLAVQWASRWQDVLRCRRPRRDVLFHAASITVLALPVIAVEVAGLALVTRLGSYSYSAVLLALAFLNVGFHFLLKAPNRGSQVLLERIAHFAASLTAGAAGGERLLDRESIAAEYEEFLPYAIALECEEAWSRQCAAKLAGAGAPGPRYQPAWHRTDSRDGGPVLGPFAGVIGDALRAALVSAAAGRCADVRRAPRPHEG